MPHPAMQIQQLPAGALSALLGKASAVCIADFNIVTCSTRLGQGALMQCLLGCSSAFVAPWMSVLLDPAFGPSLEGLNWTSKASKRLSSSCSSGPYLVYTLASL